MAEVYEYVTRSHLVGHTCDVCGKSCTPPNAFSEEIGHMMANWGYNSDKDGRMEHCDLCEGCWDKVVEFIESLGGKVRTL